MKDIIYFFVFALLVVSCSENSSSTGAAVEPSAIDTSGYITEDIAGANLTKAYKKDKDGNLLEEGFLKNGLRSGTWVTYEAGIEFPKTVASYVDGKYNGIYMEFNQRGQLALRATYVNNKLDGFWGQYRFGRPEKTAEYKDGELNGVYKEYYSRDGSLQKEVHYKMGKEDGVYRFYNEAGEVTLEYEYKDGERIGGGIIDESKPNEPK